MKMKVLLLDPGTVIVWKKYSLFKRLFSKLFKKELKYNRYTVIQDRTELFTLGTFKDMKVLEPIKKYSKQEAKRLKIWSGLFSLMDWSELYWVINLIRPNTITNNSTDENGLLTSNYYRLVKNEKLDEYIY